MFIVFNALLYISKIGEASYCFLIASAALVGLVLHGFDRLKELDLKNLRIVLRELKDTKHELFVREEKLKSVALPLAQIAALTGVSEGRLGSKETWAAKRKWYRSKIEELIASLPLNAEETLEAKKYIEKYTALDELLADRNNLKASDPGYAKIVAKLEIMNQELLDMLKSDVDTK